MQFRNRSLSVAVLMSCVGLSMPAMAQEKKEPVKPVTPSAAPSKVTQPQPGVAPANVGATAPGAQPVAKPVDTHGGLQPSDPAQSPLAWDTMSHEFGNIPDTEPVTHVFKFTNKLDKTVTIQSATGSCGCTVPELKKKTFAPGEAGEMTVTFNPQHRRGANPKAITIMYTEPAGTPNTILTINSMVQPLVIIDPIKMYMMEVDAKQGKTSEITVSGRKSDFKVETVECTNPAVQISIGTKRETQIDGETFQQYPVSVSIKPGTPIGEIQTELVIKTNEEKALQQSYMFVADVVGDLKATPPKLTLRAFTPNIPFANVVTLESRSGKPFKISSVDVEGREDMQLVADVERNDVAGKPSYTIRLNGVTPDVTGMVTGEIIVKTDLPDNPELRLPFSTSIRGSAAAKPVGPVAPISH